MYDVAIIGCGIIGAAAAYELSKYQLSVLVLERDNDVSNGTSKANSGILHAGYDPEPGTLMAELNVEGARLAAELCEKLQVPYRRCGSLVVAFSQEELPMLQALYERGQANGVPGLELWDEGRIRQEEPQVSGQAVGALYAPTAAIVSPWEYALALAETSVRNGVELRLSSGVDSIDRTAAGYRLHTTSGPVEARMVLNAAGLDAERIHNMVAAPTFRIIPDKGEYYLLDKSEGNMVQRVIFQCPTKLGKGVLVSPTAHGNLLVGPNSQVQEDPADVSTSAKGLSQVAQAARKSVPGLALGATIRTFSGVRALSSQEDFIIAEAADAPGFVDLAGIKSPGLTAAPAIAKRAVQLLEKAGLTLRPKAEPIDRRTRIAFGEMSAEAKQQLIAQNPSYGRVICRCETITEGEILDAIHSPIPPASIDAVKRRCNAGMGRCQGGFCGPRVMELLSDALGVSPLAIVQDKAGSYVLTGETKEGD